MVVGAGVSGLACAQRLTEAGRPVLVLERARGVGGRCATRQVGNQAVDFGPAFLHGQDPEFLRALHAVPATSLPGWPEKVEGQGSPCQPEAFAPDVKRLTFAQGVAAFPRSLATGLDVRLEQTVERIRPAEQTVVLETASGQQHPAPVVVLALAAEQSRNLLLTMDPMPPSVRGAVALLGLSHSQPCLTLIALYPEGSPRPPWQVCYPQSSKVLRLVSFDSSKRPTPAQVALVLQARPAWSRAHLEDPSWAQALLAEARDVVGDWAGTPQTQSAHRWTWAVNDGSGDLAAPMLLELPGGGQVGVCGDRFAPGGGVEAAWRSGRALAARIIQESTDR